jgi:hypothetical protein
MIPGYHWLRSTAIGTEGRNKGDWRMPCVVSMYQAPLSGLPNQFRKGDTGKLGNENRPCAL